MIKELLKNKTSWEYIKDCGKPVVIYGMGNGADKIIDEFERLGITVKGVTASDDFVRGQIFRGFRVKKLSEFAGDFVLTIAFASCIPTVTEHIFSLTEKYDVVVPCVPVYGDEIFNRDFALKHYEEIQRAYSLFDDKSKSIYKGCIEFLLSGKLEVLKIITTDKHEAFKDILKINEREYYFDLGAYRGDTIDELLKLSCGKYSEITAVEPDKKTFAKLCNHIAGLPNITAINCAVTDISGTVCFSQAAGRQSCVSGKGEIINSVCIDDLCLGKNVSYIKMDIEGAESAALSGAAQTISEKKPKLNVALYHRSEDIFSIPLKIKEMNPNYEFHIRKHPYIPCWDMNLYCV